MLMLKFDSADIVILETLVLEVDIKNVHDVL